LVKRMTKRHVRSGLGLAAGGYPWTAGVDKWGFVV
jgi:hypothetical protein